MVDVLILPDDSEVEIDPDDFEVDVDGLGTITAHANRGSSRLIERFQKPVYLAILRAVADEIQEAENMLWNVLLSRYIDDAFGKSLDYIGNRVGEPRQDLDDPDYRTRIRARILINKSAGRPEDILAIVRALGSHGHLTNTGNASMRVDITEDFTNGATRRQVADLLGQATAGGVRLHVSRPATATPFRLGDAFTDTSFGGILQDHEGGAVADAGQLTDGRSV